MDYLNRGKEFKYIDVREGRKVINTGKNKPTVHPPQTNKQTDRQTNILHLYIIEYRNVREGRKVINTGKNKPTVHP